MRSETQGPLEGLVVGHWPGGAPAARTPFAWRLDTCLRSLLVGRGREAARALAKLAPPEVHAGAAAYAFLLEVACGLRSAIPGETNVFGQFKRAWESQRRDGSPVLVETLGAVVAAVIRDTRAIRSAHLANIGGASYGGLVRRLLGAGAADRVLFVGAGELARSMLPFFRAVTIATWNRSPPGPAFAAAGRVFAPGDAAAAACWADHVILTTPADAAHDARWQQWLRSGRVRTIVHLGQRRGSAWHGPPTATTYDLDDVFDLRRSQDNIRSLQVERARHACRDRALALSRASAPAGAARPAQHAAG